MTEVRRKRNKKARVMKIPKKRKNHRMIQRKRMMTKKKMNLIYSLRRMNQKTQKKMTLIKLIRKMTNLQFKLTKPPMLGHQLLLY